MKKFVHFNSPNWGKGRKSKAKKPPVLGMTGGFFWKTILLITVFAEEEKDSAFF
jgi:hypothetical protein